MFGGGPHFCLGYHVAIAEGSLVLLTLARALAEAGLASHTNVVSPIARARRAFFRLLELPLDPTAAAA